MDSTALLYGLCHSFPNLDPVCNKLTTAVARLCDKVSNVLPERVLFICNGFRVTNGVLVAEVQASTECVLL